ncbi:OVARIAN TUMOR DOMAIN-containing deubiquitinating enzyme 9-like isoform X1 [Corylus avellana]|uniref:OVARIAN TUMOR DOMAIN-containing deubiquitinating enzyme 9-like isoform X1 n=1 Tax=Corylus avellana TaxID=13451 RepID=UPI002869F103|nr:OVARIAN TUMOR DOMAIN-containing deubiquitinating enzyme 9-like isoform X1 [Corylus avellana]
MRMATYDLDPDVTRWGLHLLDVCTLTNNGCCNAITRYDQDLSQVEYVNEGYCENAYVENDEAVARALQEEFTRIDSLEASGLSNVGEENIQSSVLAQDWLGPSKRHYSTGNDNDKKGTSNPGRNMEEADDCSKMENYVVAEIGNFHPCFSPGEKSSYVEDFSNTLDITDESVLDGEVGKRLNQMVPVPHVPKTNEKIPSADEEITDHQRLLERLQLYDLVELKVQGDGNCQFRALSDQLYRSHEHHAVVREQIIRQLKSQPEKYEGYVPMAYNDYLKKMSKNGEWGDHVTLQAAADWYGVKMFVLTSFKDTCYIEILPHNQKSKRIIFLSFWAEVHYNSIYPEGDLPASDTRKKKKWWNLGSLMGT